MEVKEKYETPMMEMIEFNREEVVTMSGNGGTEPQQGDGKSWRERNQDRRCGL